MEEKELKEKLNKLGQEIKPDTEWKNSNRSILISQIDNYTGSKESSSAPSFKHILGQKFAEVLKLRKAISQPAWAVLAIIFVVVGGGVGVQASQSSMPGDSLYFTKILKEKVQMAVTFDEEEKKKMGIRFASNHAKEISEVLSDKSGYGQETEDLQEDFKREIESIKFYLTQISQRDKDGKDGGDKKKERKDKPEDSSLEQEGQNQIEDNNEREENREEENEIENNGPDTDKITDNQEESDQEESDQEEESQVFSADFKKDDKGVKVHNPNKDSDNFDPNSDSKEEDKTGTTATSADSEALNKITSDDLSDSMQKKIKDAGKTIDEALELFNNEDFESTKNKLEELNIEKIFNQEDSKDSDQDPGEVKGAATSSEENSQESASSTEKQSATSTTE